jgi:hypothetical protein
MDELGLSEIESLRKSLNSREGLLIDFDYASSLRPNTKTAQADASNVKQSQDESQGSSQGSSQDSSQCESREGFEMVDDSDNNSNTVIQPIAKNFTVARTVSYF